MSVSKKVSASRTAAASASKTPTPTQNFLAVVSNSSDPNAPIGSPAISAVSENGTNYSYLPTSTLPYIGDPIGIPLDRDWKRGVIGPNPGDFGYPGILPGINTMPANMPFQLQQYWAVQRRAEKDKGGAEFWVSNPQTWPSLHGNPHIVCWCVTENDARWIEATLNAGLKEKSITRDDLWVAWRRNLGDSIGSDGIQNVLFHFSGPGKVSEVPADAVIIGYASSDSAVRIFLRGAEFAHDIDTGRKKFDLSKEPDPEKTCSCNGINEECSNCPPRPKNVVETITYHHAKDSLKSLEGRVLTVIDAAIESESRNKALKTLFKREFRKTITQFFDFCHRHMDGDHCEPVDSDE